MYIVQEIQTSANKTSITPAVSKTDRNEAESAFHGAMAAAAVSALDVHAVVMFDEHGNVVEAGYYEHKKETPV